MARSKIQWTDWSWNPVTGCTKLSSGCRNCYAEKIALDLQSEGNHKYRNGFDVTLHEYTLRQPLDIKNPMKIFVNSMSDLFHKDVPFSFIEKVFSVMNEASQHAFQILTKRPDRLVRLSSSLDWSSNIWMGISVEGPECIHRIDDLLRTHAQNRFLSLEPLLAPIPELNLDGIDWVIVGCESGNCRRPMKDDWVREIRDICNAAKVPFFYKQQYQGYRKIELPALDGRVWAEFPSGMLLPTTITA